MNPAHPVNPVSFSVLHRLIQFSQAAGQNNAGNLRVIADAALAAKYLQNWKEHAGHSSE